MTMQLQEFKFDWKALNAALNKIVAAVNSNMPLPGDQISLDGRGNLGVSINVAGQSHGADSGQQQPTQQQSTATWHGVKWKDVTVVDPTTCVQSTLTVLVFTGNNSDAITIA